MTLKMKSIAFKLFIALTFNCFFLYAQESKGNESFFVFINEFSNNEDFQMNRTLFPLECVSWDIEKDTTVTFYVNKNEWEYTKLFGDNHIQNAPHSPDIAYPIETLWAELKKRVKERRAKILDKLK